MELQFPKKELRCRLCKQEGHYAPTCPVTKCPDCNGYILDDFDYDKYNTDKRQWKCKCPRFCHTELKVYLKKEIEALVVLLNSCHDMVYYPELFDQWLPRLEERLESLSHHTKIIQHSIFISKMPPEMSIVYTQLIKERDQ